MVKGVGLAVGRWGGWHWESPTSRLFCHKTAVASYTVANSAKLYCLLEGRKVEGSFDRKQILNAMSGLIWGLPPQLKHKLLTNAQCYQCNLSRDGKSVKNSTDEYFSPKIAHKMRISKHVTIRAKTA